MHFIKSKLLFSLPFYFAFSPNFEKGKIFSIHNWSSIFLQLEWVHAVRATHIISNSRIYLENLSFIRVLRIFYYKCIFVLKEKFNLQSWKRRRRDRDAATQQEKWEVARHTPMREVKQTKLQKNVKWQNIFSWKSLFGVCFSQFFFFFVVCFRAMILLQWARDCVLWTRRCDLPTFNDSWRLSAAHLWFKRRRWPKTLVAVNIY